MKKTLTLIASPLIAAGLLLGGAGAANAVEPSVSSTVSDGIDHVITNENGVLTDRFSVDGVDYTVIFDQNTGVVEASDSLGNAKTTTVAELKSLQMYLTFQGEGSPLARKGVNGCQVATGLVGIGHSALWGAAVGGPWGAAAGAIVGGFWWAIGTQC